MNTRYWLVPAVLIALVAAGCSDLSMLSPSTESTTGVEVRSLNEGGIVRPGDSLSFVVHGESSQDMQLDIILTDVYGNSVWSRTLSAPVPNEELQLGLPELDTGQYKIVFRTSGAGSSSDEEQLIFFYTRENYAVTGLSSYPPSTLPGAEITVQASFEVPSGTDPYVRWTQGSSILGRGRISEGLQRIVWKAPREQGVYPVTVELFPVSPPGNQDFPFSSSLSMTAQLYIAATAPVHGDALVPESSYYSLFHFDGSLEDRGLLAAKAGAGQVPTAEAFGGAVHVAEAAGYRIGEGSEIRYSRLILPGGSAGLEPCTLTIVLIPEKRPLDSTLLTARSAEGELVLSVGFDAEGRLEATLRTTAGPIRLPSGISNLTAGIMRRIDLSLIVRDNTLSALWFLDGLQTASVVRPALLPPMARPGKTVLGGEKGFRGVIAELGVYYQDEQGRPAVDPAIYKAAMQNQLGASLILAEGFEGLYLPAGFGLEGSGALSTGALSLAAGARVETPLFERVLPATILEIETRSGFPSGSRIALRWEGEKEAFAEIQARGSESGTVRASLFDPGSPSGPEQGLSIDGLSNSLMLQLDGQTLAARSSGGIEPSVLTLAAPGDGNRWLKLSVFAPGQAASVELERILIYSAPRQ